MLQNRTASICGTLPIANEIRDVTHLISVPTGSLLSLPFGLLVTDKPLLNEQQSTPEGEGDTTQRGLEITRKDRKPASSDYTSVACWLNGAPSVFPLGSDLLSIRGVLVRLGRPRPLLDSGIRFLLQMPR